MSARYGVVDLATGKVYDEADDVDQALEKLDDAEFWHGDEEDGPRPQLAVIDLDRGELIEVDNGQIVRSWLDTFSGTWRRRLESVA